MPSYSLALEVRHVRPAPGGDEEVEIPHRGAEHVGGEVGERGELADVVPRHRRLDDEGQPDPGEDLRPLDGVLPGAAHAAERVVPLRVERIERERHAAGALALQGPRQVLGDLDAVGPHHHPETPSPRRGG